MSKVKNITKKIVPCLNKLINDKLRFVSQSWYIDNNENLYKIKVFEDGYLISSDSEYPEDLTNLPANNSFRNINIYLEKVNRSKFVSDKNSIFKFSFNISTSIYHYVLRNLSDEQIKFTSFQIESKKRKRSYSEDYDLKEEEKKANLQESIKRIARARKVFLNGKRIK